MMSGPSQNRDTQCLANVCQRVETHPLACADVTASSTHHGSRGIIVVNNYNRSVNYMRDVGFENLLDSTTGSTIRLQSLMHWPPKYAPVWEGNTTSMCVAMGIVTTKLGSEIGRHTRFVPMWDSFLHNTGKA